MPAPIATTISIVDALHQLDGPFQALATAVGEGQYSIWLGSGISRDRVNNVYTLIRQVLEHFQSRADLASPACVFLKALEAILEFAKLPKEYRKRLTDCINSGTPVSAWPDDVRETTLDNLVERYADVLDVQVDGQAEDYILWDVVNVATTYADRSRGPDCEHLCVALLVAEAAVSEIPTANWDGLIEAADEELRNGRGSAITVCARQEDLRVRRTTARLLKFHGCAVGALTNEAVHRPLLIARRRQIEEWPKSQTVAAWRAELVHLATQTPTLMIGLSAQDSNIKSIFTEARTQMGWRWPLEPSAPPAAVFAEDKIGGEQRVLLQLIYGDQHAANVDAIERSAHFRAYGKPLLTALVLHVLCSKLRKLVMLVDAPNLDDSERETLAEGIRRLRDRVAAAAEDVIDAKGEPDRLAFVRALVCHTAHVLGLFRFGQPRAGKGEYLPLAGQPVDRMEHDPHFELSGQRELAAALALLSRGEIEKMGTLACGDTATPNGCALSLVRAAGTVRLFFVINDDRLVQMQHDGRVKDDDDDAVVIQSGPVAARMIRSPHGIYGRTGRAGLRVVGMAPMLRHAANADSLFNDFRHGLGL